MVLDVGDDLEQWLESELVDQDTTITIPLCVKVPFKIRWIASDGSNVVENQLLATLSFLQCHELDGKHPPKSSSFETDVEPINDSIDDISTPDITTDPTGAESKNHSTNEETHITTEWYDDITSTIQSTGEGSSESTTVQDLKKPYLLRSTKHGTLRHKISTDTVVKDTSTVLGVIEYLPCQHSVVIHGLCVDCCQVVEDTGSKRYSESTDKHAKRQAHENHPDESGMVIPGFITNNNAVRVDAKVSNEMELMELLRLLQKRKLCLVLDLDNTLIHSSCSKAPDDMDIPLIDMYNKCNGCRLEFNNDEDNMRYEKELESSILITRTMNELDGRYFVNYYKLRPGVYEFLRRSSELYELYLFTMGTRSHAHAALKILDPSGKLFGNRIFSRSESNNSYKSLCRIFPNYRNLLLILDDSENVWVDAPGLIKIYPYYYFTDLSLIKNRDSRNLSRVSAALQAHCNYSNYTWHSVIMDIWKENETRATPVKDMDGFAVPMGINIPGKISNTFRYNNLLIANERPSNIFKENTDNEPGTLSKDINHTQSRKHSNTTPSSTTPNVTDLTTQKGNAESPPSDNSQSSGNTVTEAEDSIGREQGDTTGSNNTSAVSTTSKDVQTSPENTEEVQTKSFTRKLRKIHVRDYDKQLLFMTRLLSEMHNQFFTSFDATDLTIERLKNLIEEKHLPDVGSLLGEYRKSILHGIVLSVNASDFRCPRTNEDVDFFSKTDLGCTARRFGAEKPSAELEATHYLCNNISPIATAPGIKRVHSQWLEACIYTWCHVPESGFDPSGWKEPYRTFWDVLNTQQP
ncbi:RNA polymerase II subunit A C-terminal domain phosphatase [Babesia ovis]|uniref:protein-serine/threonine phosphatase n=1 Tax=Babesia ovis TaxID=5869 RepID=A0A9W5T7H8_BABOV|nr:RNA polymerase II subunit A C-terminal domain phosphatase [Babesia ovis]